MQALRTLFNVAHRLGAVLGPSWELVIETLAALDRTIHASHATSQDASGSGARTSRDGSAAASSDFSVLSSLDAQVGGDGGGGGWKEGRKGGELEGDGGCTTVPW